MKRYLDLVPISAKVHKKQNRMSIFCIALAVFLVTAIFGMADMFIRSQIIKTQAETGNWHIGIQNISSEDAAVIAARPDVAALAPYNVLNYDGKKGYTLAETEVVLCGSNDRLFAKIFPNMLSEGTFPKTDYEAMVTESAKDMLDLHIGDEITINTPAGLKLIFTLSGFVENTANLISSDTYGVFCTTEKLYDIFSMNESDRLTDYPTVYYVQFASTVNVQSKIEHLKSQCGLSGDQVSENTKLLGLLGQSTSSFMIQVYAAAAVLFVLVLFAGIMMIASSLNSNVAQRTEFYGLMRCVGATPKQVMRMVRKEALTWCKSAIPAGVVIGVVVIWILCFALRLLSPEYFGAMPLFSTSYPSIIAGVVVGLLTVLMAARTPAKRAAKVSPLSAVSGNANNTQPVKKAANTDLFKVDAALGIHHAKASRKNFILMVGSFGLSIVLFLAFSVTIEFMNHTLRPLHPWTPDISIVSPDNACSVNRAYLDELKNNAAVKSAYGRMFAYNVSMTANGQEQQTDLISYEQKQFEWAKSYMLGGSLDTVQNELNTGLIVYEPQNTIQIGDTVSLSFNGQTAEIEIVGMLSDSPFYNSADVRTIICSEDTFRQLTGQSDYTVIDMQLTNCAADAEVNAIHRTYGAGYSFVDKRMDNSSTLSIYYCVWLFLYGFLALIALITVFNIINSIAMSVAARTKQYGAFRAIGLSDRQLSKMIIAEAAAYAIAGSIVGAVLGVICNKILFDLLISRQWGDPWLLPWGKLMVIVFIVLFSVVVAVHAPIKRIRNMSIVDTISAQ